MNRGKVLLVCDDPRGFPSYGGILSARGYDVVMCSSYEEGARRVEMEDFDFAIVGQGSASFEGRCVLERAAKMHRNIPIVVVARCLDIHCYLEAMELAPWTISKDRSRITSGGCWKPNCAGATQIESYQPCEVARILRLTSRHSSAKGYSKVMKRKRLDLPMMGIVASSCSSTKAALSYKMARRIKRC